MLQRNDRYWFEKQLTNRLIQDLTIKHNEQGFILKRKMLVHFLNSYWLSKSTIVIIFLFSSFIPTIILICYASIKKDQKQKYMISFTIFNVHCKI